MRKSNTTASFILKTAISYTLARNDRHRIMLLPFAVTDIMVRTSSYLVSPKSYHLLVESCTTKTRALPPFRLILPLKYLDDNPVMHAFQQKLSFVIDQFSLLRAFQCANKCLVVLLYLFVDKQFPECYIRLSIFAYALNV
mmetsp:Transcript_20707/g.30824  ORF Transcript_20707/g.30824 Transcript_20707/m.30824 type:complete len:140 (+) Transcript_20707:233-652(+)